MRRLRSFPTGWWRQWTPLALAVAGLMTVGSAVGGIRLGVPFDLDIPVPELPSRNPVPNRASIPGHCPWGTPRWGSSPSGPRS